MSGSDLRQGDLQRILNIVEEGHRDDPGEAMPWSVMEGLLALVPCDMGINLLENDYEHSRCLLIQWQDPGERGLAGPDDVPVFDEDRFWALFWDSASSYPQRTGDLTRVVCDGDFGPDPVFLEYLRPLGVAHTMYVSLPAAPGHYRRFMFTRSSGAGFSEPERQLMQLLRPHLYEIWLAAERRRGAVPKLTRREWEVLTLSAGGLTNPQIAHRLVISAGTVRKHMEHILERLQAHTRAEAVALALPHRPGAADKAWSGARVGGSHPAGVRAR